MYFSVTREVLADWRYTLTLTSCGGVSLEGEGLRRPKEHRLRHHCEDNMLTLTAAQQVRACYNAADSQEQTKVVLGPPEVRGLRLAVPVDLPTRLSQLFQGELHNQNSRYSQPCTRYAVYVLTEVTSECRGDICHMPTQLSKRQTTPLHHSHTSTNAPITRH